MTLFCGVLYLDGNAGDNRDIEDLMQYVVYADKSRTWQDEAVMVTFGQHTLFSTPQSLLEELPLYQNDTGLAIVGNIRLDDRESLCTKLSVPASARNTIGDAALILAAYQKWGNACAEHLLGDFAFVIWDANIRQLFCCRDHMGIASMFYYYNGKKFVFATHLQQLLDCKDIPNTINRNQFSRYAVPEAKNLFWHETWVKDVFHIPAGSVIIVDKNGLKINKYWTPSFEQEHRYKNEHEFTDAFQEVMFRAVEDRMRSHYPVTALLSGGLDSSSIVSIAAKLLEKQNKQLDVFSAVLPEDGNDQVKDERYFIDLFKSFPNIRINYVTAPGTGFFSNMEKLQTNLGSPNLTSRHYLYQAFEEKAQQLGSRLILDGVGGELGPTNHGWGGYAEMFLKLQWSQLWKELNAKKKLTGISEYTSFRNDVLRHILGPSVIDFAKGRNSFVTPVERLFLQPDFAAQIQTEILPRDKEIKEINFRTFPDLRKNQLRTMRLAQAKSPGGSDFAFGNYAFPFKDKRILEFSLTAPMEYQLKNGHKRYMIRVGMDKILPEEIRWRTDKTAFSPDYLGRYKAQVAQLQQFLAGIAPTDPIRAIIDIEKLKRWAAMPVAELAKDTFTIIMCRDIMPQAVYLIHFLRRFNEFKTKLYK